MPEKLVRKRFHEIFGVNVFVLTEEAAFALDPKDSVGLIKKCANSRTLAIILAEADYYNGCHINSLASQFYVSATAIAIRIEELNLIETI